MRAARRSRESPRRPPADDQVVLALGRGNLHAICAEEVAACMASFIGGCGGASLLPFVFESPGGMTSCVMPSTCVWMSPVLAATGALFGAFDFTVPPTSVGNNALQGFRQSDSESRMMAHISEKLVSTFYSPLASQAIVVTNPFCLWVTRSRFLLTRAIS